MSKNEAGREQEYVSMLYGRLDDLRKQTSARLAKVLLEVDETPQALTERDVSSAMYTDRLAQLRAAENGLVFGRLDLHDGTRRYVGRLGILDSSAGYEPLLTDWRAPAARPFYVATAASPEGVRRRRHIRTRTRTVVGLDDDVFDLADRRLTGQEEELSSEAALMAVLAADRTGRMHDIVDTIQAEQDRVIRSGHDGVLVVQGGPGTGKTAVALHRAAFLLFTHRRRLARSGVLIVGPNPTFMRYVGQVLPALGETGVLLSTIGDLFPGVQARRAERPEVAEVKGRLAMVDVVAAAVRDRQRVPAEPVEIPFDDDVLRLEPGTVLSARGAARQTRRPHNQARSIFILEIIDALARQVADRLGEDVLGGENLLEEAEVDDIRRELLADIGVRRSINDLWPVLTPQRLLAELLSSPSRLASAAAGLTEAERSLLLRDHLVGQSWTPADVPLLDEAAELLGEDDRVTRALEERRRQERIAFAQGVLDILSRDVEDDADPEILMAYDLMDAERMADRHVEIDNRTTAQRAAADRQWVFGHVVVDEAQDLSEMAWRMLMRRCPSRSMTVVGDIAQTGELAGTSSWDRVLRPYLGGRWQLEQLTVNYRTPAEIMAVAADVLEGLDPPVDPPRSVRSAGEAPWRLAVGPGELADRLGDVVAREAAAVGRGRMAVVVPADRLDELGSAVRSAVTDVAVGEDAELENQVVVLTVKQVKGLEFDAVLVVEPEQVVAGSPRGRNDLYVALTRATRRLGVLHTGELPAMLARLQPLGGLAESRPGPA